MLTFLCNMHNESIMVTLVTVSAQTAGKIQNTNIQSVYLVIHQVNYEHYIKNTTEPSIVSGDRVAERFLLATCLCGSPQY